MSSGRLIHSNKLIPWALLCALEADHWWGKGDSKAGHMCAGQACSHQGTWHIFWGVQAYVHRVGRTGRAGQAGTAVTLFADQDEPLRRELLQELGHSSASALEGAEQCTSTLSVQELLCATDTQSFDFR